ncbi:MAG: hypothetical protein LBB75_04570 [Oscillospiraceae bacterium]|jgi:hypothetical protein|nr:hypothetical protein [Oscillospiraceae bacterium]
MKKALWVMGAVLVVAAAYALSLFDVSMGNPATIYNVTTTVCYIAFWALYLVFNQTGRKRLTFSCVLSGVTFVCSCAITCINFAKIVLRPGNFVLMLTFFSTPFYGVRFLVHKFVWFNVVVTLISCVWFGCSVFLRKRKK